MKKTKRFLSLLMTLLMVFSLVPVMETEAEAAGEIVTYDEVTKLVEDYMSQCAGRYWNAGKKYSTLKAEIDNGTHNYVKATTTKNCGGWYTEDSEGNTIRSGHDRACTSNSFSGAFIKGSGYGVSDQCCGFGWYLAYIVFGEMGGWTKKTSVSNSFTFHPGDVLRLDGHSAFIYKVTSKYVYVAECNYGFHTKTNNSGNCLISYGRAIKPSYLRNRINISDSDNFVLVSPAVSCVHSWKNDGTCANGCGASYDYNATRVPISGSLNLNGGTIGLYTQPYRPVGNEKQYFYSEASGAICLNVTATVVNAVGAGANEATKAAHTWYEIYNGSTRYYAYCAYSADKGNIKANTPYFEAKKGYIETVPKYYVGLSNHESGKSSSDIPASIIAGTSIWVNGKVVSHDGTIKSITAGIYNLDGSKALSKVYSNSSVNSYEFNLSDSDKNNCLMFSQLTAGKSYVFRVSVTTSNGNTYKPIERTFFVSSGKTRIPEYTVILDYNGGYIGRETSKTMTIRSGSSIDLTPYVPVQDGWEFLGWAQENTTEGIYNGIITPHCSGRMVAVWQIVNPPATPVLTSLDQTVGTGTAVTVSWRAVSAASSYDVRFYDEAGNAVFTVNTAGTSASYIFNTPGHYTARVKAVNTAGESEESAAANITAKAPSTVTFLNYDGTVWASQQIAYGASAVAPANPSRTGYRFNGWDGALTNVTGDRTLTATFVPIEYKVTFYDYNGRALTAQSVSYDGDTPGAATEPSVSELNIPEGYVLAGWDTDDWKSVTRDNIKVYPCVAWENEDIPITTTVTSVTKAGSGYWVFYTIENHVDEAESGRVVVALKSGFGKFLTKTESGAFYLDGNGSYSGNIYVPVSKNIRDETFAWVEAYVVSSYSELVPISTMAQYSILEDDDSDWSAWMTEEEYNAYVGDKSETQTKTEYRTSSRSVSDWMTNESYLDWTLLDSRTVLGDWGSWSSWQDAMVTEDEHTDVETQQVQTAAAYKMYRYGKYVSTSAGYGVDGDYYSKGWGHFHQGYYKTGYSLSYSSWSKSKTSPTTTKFGWWASNNAAKTGTKSGSKYYWNKYSVGGTSYFWEEAKTVAATYKTQYRYRSCSDVEQYRFYQWGDWSAWSDLAATPTDDLKVQTRTMYRVKLPSSEAGDGETISGTVSIDGITDLAGRQAILNVYKVDEASDYSNEYIAQTTLGANGTYSFTNVRTYEDPTVKTGDFTVTLTIEGSSGPMVIETGLFKAPKPEYEVIFVDGVTNEQIGETVKVEEGGSVTAPDAPVKDAYTFLGWEYGLTNIRDNMTIRAVYVPKTFTVVYVDFNNSTITMQTDVPYGTALSVSDPPAIDGYAFKGWKAEDGADVSCVTRSMIVTAQYDKLSYTVTFMDAAGEIVSTQQVEHGESAEAPAADVLNIPDNMYLDDWSEDIWTVTQPMEVSPVLLYEEDAPEPTADLASGVYVGTQTVTLPTYDDQTIITYRLITESSIAAEEAVADADAAIELLSLDGADAEYGSSGERVYTQPITLSESAVLEVTSTKEGTNSVTETYEYIIVPEGSRPDAPAALAAKAYSDHVELTWDAVDGADGYIIYKSDVYGNEERLMSESNSYSDSNVASITDYIYSVKAYHIYTEGETQTYLVSDGETESVTVRFYGEQYAVEKISVEAPATLLVGDTEQLYADVSPENAYDTAVLWSVTDGTGSATVTDSGLMTAQSAGTVTVTAAAKDGSGVVGSAEVTITEAREGVAQLAIGSASVIGGRAFTIPVYISEGSDLTSLQFTLLYDSSLLTLSAASAGALLKDNAPEINTSVPGEVLFVWDSLKGLTDGGCILEMTFAGVSADDATDTLITIPGAGEMDAYDFICTDSTFEEVACEIINGKVSILDLGYGDINGDGKVNVLDVSLARRSAARLVQLQDWQLAAGDVNGDGKINVADVSLMRRYAAKLITSFPVQTA